MLTTLSHLSMLLCLRRATSRVTARASMRWHRRAADSGSAASPRQASRYSNCGRHDGTTSAPPTDGADRGPGACPRACASSRSDASENCHEPVSGGLRLPAWLAFLNGRPHFLEGRSVQQGTNGRLHPGRVGHRLEGTAPCPKFLQTRHRFWGYVYRSGHSDSPSSSTMTGSHEDALTFSGLSVVGIS